MYSALHSCSQICIYCVSMLAENWREENLLVLKAYSLPPCSVRELILKE